MIQLLEEAGSARSDRLEHEAMRRRSPRRCRQLAAGTVTSFADGGAHPIALERMRTSDAVLLLSFGGPEGPSRCRSWRTLPGPKRLDAVAEHYPYFWWGITD